MLAVLPSLFGVSHAKALSAAVNIPEAYAEVIAGGKVYIETEIKWPENDYRKDLRIEYSIKDNNGEEIAYLMTLKAIETQASFMESISIPAGVKGGLYRVDVTVSDYNVLSHNIATSFKVIEQSRDMFNTYLLIILGVVVLVAVLLTLNLLALTNLRRRAALNVKRR
jgi:hypothetical protein